MAHCDFFSLSLKQKTVIYFVIFFNKNKSATTILHTEVVRYLLAAETVLVCVGGWGGGQDIRVLFLQFVLSVHHGHDGLTELHCRRRRDQRVRTHTETAHTAICINS